MTGKLPTSARVVIIGGGIMGCSTAYHLAKTGWSDVLLLERKQMTCGTTWHSAAQVRQLRSTASLTRLIRHSVDLYTSLEAETGQATGWVSKGSLSVAANPDRLTHIKRQASLARLFGVEAEVIDVEEAAKLWPLMRTDDLKGAVFSPGDGRVNPSDVCAALIKGAKAAGVKVIEDTAVTGFEKTSGRVSAVVTDGGRIHCEAVALCAGLWSREVARLAGVTAPLYACEHFYLLTEAMEGVTGHLPTLSDHDSYLYLRDDVGGLLVGCFEPNAKPLPLDKLPNDFAFDLLNEDWDHFEPMLLGAMHRIPALESAEARMLLNGPESFTPDGAYMLGESPDLDGFFLGCGMNSVGVASGGGAGKALAEWIMEGRPGMDLSEVDVRRFAPFQNNLKALHDRIPEELGLHYAIAYPGRHHETVRGLRRTPIHGLLEGKGGVFGSRAGWERPEYFTPPGETAPPRDLTFGRPPWFGLMAAEHRAAREGSVIVDQSTFSKFMMQGPDAETVLQRLCANDLAVEPGRIVYTAMLNEAGGFESDLTVLRLNDEAFLIVTGTAQGTRDGHWIRRHMNTEDRAVLTDVTSAYAVLGVAGPASPELLARVSGEDMEEAAFPHFTHRQLEVGYATVTAARLSYTGETGWELYVPSEFAAGTYEALHAAAGDNGLRDIGTLALSSLRIECGFRAWGHDVTPADTPLEAGLGFAVNWDKPVPFVGRNALVRQRDEGLSRRLVFLTLEDEAAYPIGGEPILHDGVPVGQVSSATFGHTVGQAVCMGYVERPPAEIDTMSKSGGFAVDIACAAASARVAFTAPRG